LSPLGNSDFFPYPPPGRSSPAPEQLHAML
jgi:hypothetical protein